MEKRLIMFGFLSMMLIVPMSCGATLDPIPIDDKNETILQDYEQLYNETKETLIRYVDDYRVFLLERELILSNNIITYYYNGKSYPYPDKYISSVLSHNPSYGENETYLGQVVDSYFNDDYVDSMYNVINNVTLGCMELNFTGLNPYENFSNYVEVDELGSIEVTDSRISGSLIRNERSFVYRDYGIDYFDDFYHNFTLDVSDVDVIDTSTYTLATIWCVGNVYGDIQYDLVSGECIFVYLVEDGANDDKFTIRVQQRNAVGGVLWSGTSKIFELDILYIGCKRDGTDITINIYSDVLRTVLEDSLTSGDSGAGTDYRYLLPYGSVHHTTDPNDYVTCYVEDLEIGIITSYPMNGVYYTEELLNGDRALSIMYNASIPFGTGITMEFSIDNSTWVNHNNVSGFESLVDGFENIDLRDLNTSSLYVRTTFSGNGSVTSRMYQLRFVTIIEVRKNLFLMPTAIIIIFICAVIILKWGKK